MLANVNYLLSESTIAGYMASDWSCDGGTLSGSTVTLTEGEAVTCTINNHNSPPTLKLVKTVTNDDGGKKVPNDWTLSATAAAPWDGRNFNTAGGSGTFETMYANAGYDLSESTIAGYRRNNFV